PAGTDEKLPAALDHIDAVVVEVGAGDLLCAAHADLVAGVGAAAATTVRGEQVIPAVVIHQVGGFAVDREVARRVVRIFAFPGFGVELDQADVAEVRPVYEPQTAIVRVEHDAGVDCVGVLDAVGGGDDATLFP